MKTYLLLTIIITLAFCSLNKCMAERQWPAWLEKAKKVWYEQNKESYSDIIITDNTAQDFGRVCFYAVNHPDKKLNDMRAEIAKKVIFYRNLALAATSLGLVLSYYMPHSSSSIGSFVGAYAITFNISALYTEYGYKIIELLNKAEEGVYA